VENNFLDRSAVYWMWSFTVFSVFVLVQPYFHDFQVIQVYTGIFKELCFYAYEILQKQTSWEILNEEY
jgi:hypothetical protein